MQDLQYFANEISKIEWLHMIRDYVLVISVAVMVSGVALFIAKFSQNKKGRTVYPWAVILIASFGFAFSGWTALANSYIEQQMFLRLVENPTYEVSTREEGGYTISIKEDVSIYTETYISIPKGFIVVNGVIHKKCRR